MLELEAGLEAGAALREWPRPFGDRSSDVLLQGNRNHMKMFRLPSMALFLLIRSW